MAPKRILHIEDNPSNRKAVRHILRQTDYELTEAVDGEEGIHAALESLPTSSFWTSSYPSSPDTRWPSVSEPMSVP